MGGWNQRISWAGEDPQGSPSPVFAQVKPKNPHHVPEKAVQSERQREMLEEKPKKMKLRELRSRKLVSVGFLGKPLEWLFLRKSTLEYWPLGQALKIPFAFVLFQNQQQNRRLCWVFPEGFSRTYHLRVQQFTPESHVLSLNRIPGPFSVGWSLPPVPCLIPPPPLLFLIYSPVKRAEDVGKEMG